MSKINGTFSLPRFNSGDEVKERSYRRKLLMIRIFRVIICIIFCVMSIFPFYTVIINSTLSSGDVQRGINLIPGNQFFINFDNLVKKAANIDGLSVTKTMFNSLIISVPSTILAVYFSTMTAYGIHVYNFKLKKFAWAFILGIMMIPAQVSIIGFLKLMMKVNLYDNFLPLIIPAIAAPSTVFFMRQYMKTGLPLEIVEAARIDGSSEIRTFNAIAMPLMKPAVATQAIFAFIASWNNLYTPSMMLSSAENTTLPMFVQILKAEQFRADYGLIYTGILVTILPILVIYALLSKFIIAGVALGGVKE